MTEQEPPVSPPKHSTRYIVFSACLAAIVLGFTLFLLIRGFQWRGALSDLRAEPGIEILSVERVGFFKKRLRGLRDPLAPSAESYLRKHNIGAHSVDIALAEYHSLNTPYAIERNEKNAEEVKQIRDDLVKTVGDFAAGLKEQREQDLEKITQMLFEARFPESMKTVRINWERGSWFVEGELYAPDLETFLAESPQYIIEGDVDYTGLINLTETRTRTLRNDIENTNLLETNLDGELVHLDRIRRLLIDLDDVCRKSDLPLPVMQLTLTDRETPQIKAIRSALFDGRDIDESRCLPEAKITTSETGNAVARLMLVQLSAP
ncbi:MAG: hypothetical protein P1U68_17990 [Verrucomicrobiales bacterium]|nr:hypothetical protein [Verrucomicrobiales bacterium]